MIGMVVTGHGHFATGLTSSVQLIAGMPEKYVAVDFKDTDSTDDLEKNLVSAFEELKDCDSILVFSDLVGGSPFKVSVELSMKLQEQYKIVVVSGSNLGMLIEANMARTFIEDVNSLADMIINTGKDQVMKYEYVERVEEENFEDGI